MFEAFVFVFSIVTLGLQYINLYKTVWWLPNSHSNYALNFYLIDPYLFTLLIIINGRRVLYMFVNEFYVGRSHWKLWSYSVQGIKFFMALAIIQLLSFCLYQVVERHSLMCCLFILYPPLIYITLFNFEIGPWFGQVHPTQEKGTPKHRSREPVGKDLPVHGCDMVPENCRNEVEYLKIDFNARVKQCLFNSMTCAYYMTVVPLCFADNSLYYDAFWCWQHVVLVWLSSFVMFMVYLLPSKYLDTLHCSALHLGKWIKVEGRNMHVPYIAWSELQVWPKGATVKHVKGLFKADGVNNCAEPGNAMHSKFHFMFYTPCRVTNGLLGLTLFLVAYQFWSIVCSSDWSHLVGLSCMLFCNYYMLFKLLRDRFVMLQVYPTIPQSKA